MPWFFNASRVSATRVIAREGKPRTGRRSLETIAETEVAVFPRSILTSSAFRLREKMLPCHLRHFVPTRHGLPTLPEKLPEERHYCALSWPIPIDVTLPRTVYFIVYYIEAFVPAVSSAPVAKPMLRPTGYSCYMIRVATLSEHTLRNVINCNPKISVKTQKLNKGEEEKVTRTVYNKRFFVLHPLVPE